MKPERLQPDPAVAIVAYRLPSETRAEVAHDVALMVGDCACYLPVAVPQETRIVCRGCGRPIRFWDCTCERATLGGEPCKHIPLAIEAYRAERDAGRSP